MISGLSYTAGQEGRGEMFHDSVAGDAGRSGTSSHIGIHDHLPTTADTTPICWS